MQAHISLRAVGFFVLCTSMLSCDAMHRFICDDEDFFDNSNALVSLLAAPSVVALSPMLDNADVSPLIKTPAFAGAFLLGAYGTDWQRPPQDQTLAVTYVQTGAALAGVGYLVKKLELPPEHKIFIYTFFAGTSLCRLWRAHNHTE